MRKQIRTNDIYRKEYYGYRDIAVRPVKIKHIRSYKIVEDDCLKVEFEDLRVLVFYIQNEQDLKQAIKKINSCLKELNDAERTDS